MPCRIALLVLSTLAAGFLSSSPAGETPAAPPPPRASSLVAGFTNPPREARLRAYWWWLNGNVTKEAITRDLEQMQAQGFGGALICDAGGAEQDGNGRVPHGPDFFSPEWRALYKHALREADRLGLEMSLNIQSGWNLGGPLVKPEDAPKKLVWSVTRCTGPAGPDRQLAEPKHPPEFYRDVAVVAFPMKPVAERPTVNCTVTASSSLADHPVEQATDGDDETFWVSGGQAAGQGPTAQRAEWLRFDFAAPITLAAVRLRGRPGYGPRDGEVQVSDDGETWRRVAAFALQDRQDWTANLAERVRTAHVRFAFFRSYDPRFPQSPRNVQVAEAGLFSADGAALGPASSRRRPIQNWDKKALHKALSFSAPDTSPLLQDLPATAGEEDARAADVLDLTDKLSADGRLRWDVPAGEWEVLRFGCTLNDHGRVSTCSEGWQGYALDPFAVEPFRAYWQQVVEPLIDDAGPLAGRALKYLHTDSWEVEVANWTPTLREEFRSRRGYDLRPFLPVIAGRIVDSRPVSNRFLNDFRRTMGDLAIDNHYRHFADWAHRRGLEIHPESGGPHAVPVDAQQCLGHNDVPMSEFWAWSWRHRLGDANRFFVKQPASAAHTYGRRIVAAEGFTTIGPHWQETLWDNLKPAFDKASCEGLNRLVWHAFTCSPAEAGLPGQEYFAGTHFNPQSTWWSRSAPFLAYINRCQFLLQQGLFVADASYYYGDHVPNFAQRKATDPARVLPGHDYDVVTDEVILTRMSVRDGNLVLPDGMSYRVLVLADRPNISVAVLRKVREFATAGATVIGPKPEFATGLSDFPECDREVARLAAELWADCDGQNVTEHRVGAGRIIWGRTARDVLHADGVAADFEFVGGDAETEVDFIHRRDGEAEIYFVASRGKRAERLDCTFRVAGKQPELWDPVTGVMRPAATWTEAAGRTTVPLEFPPCGSLFVIFREPAPTAGPVAGGTNFATLAPRGTLDGPWTVQFSPRWGGPESIESPELVSWTTRPEPGIKFYSGTATYAKTFDLPAGSESGSGQLAIWLDLGDVKQLAEVRLNGVNLGIVWSPPFRVNLAPAVQPTGNRLEIDIVNFWPNRVIGDQFLPEADRFTRTNIRKLTKETPLIESGLLGPVQLLTE